MKKRIVVILFIITLIFDFSLFAGGTKETKEKTVKKENIKGIILSNLDGKTGKYFGQFEIDEFTKITGESISFSGNPLFDEMEVMAEDRLPKEPLIIVPDKNIGQYGGIFRAVCRAPESGTSGILSVRHANLVRMSQDLTTVVPDVAKSFSWNSDFTEVTFKLRKDHKWSDGKPFTTDDILFWWEDIQLNKTLIPNTKSKWIFDGKPMEVIALDKTTVKFVFSTPAPGFLGKLAVDYCSPFQPKHILKNFHEKYNPNVDKLAKELGYSDWSNLFYTYYHDWKDTYHPLSGKKPIQVPTLETHVLYDETTEYRKFKANPYYHAVDTKGQQLPYMNEIYEVFMEDKEVANLKIVNGEIDFKSQGLELTDFPILKEYSKKGNYNIRLIPTGMSYSPAPGLNVNHQDPVLSEIFGNLKFREALSLAINRDEINEITYLGIGRPMAALPAVPPRVNFITPELENYMTNYDPDNARSLLDQIGLKKDKNGFRLRPDGKPLVIYMTYSTQGAASKVWELVAEYWNDIGVRVELKEVNTDLYIKILEANDHDVSCWSPVSTEPPNFYDIQENPFLPPFGDKNSIGVEWKKWIFSDGKEGVKPPNSILKQVELYKKFVLLEPHSKEYNEIGKKMSEYVVKNLYLIGLVGDVKLPVVVNNRLKNVGTISYKGFSYYYNYPNKPCQWYIEE